MTRQDLRDFMIEVFAPGTIAELIVIFTFLIAPAAILFSAGE